MSIDDCWRRIGVASDRSCAELERQVHCRNCAVYADAARRSLQRPVDAGYREAWARELALPEPAPEALDAAAMVFRVGAEWLAVPVALASTVAPPGPVHRLPHRSGGALLGVVNVGGRVLPAVSLAPLLGIASAGVPAPNGRHAFERLLVLEVQGQRVAMPVAEVRGILRHASEAMRAPAATLGRLPSPLLAGVIGDGATEAGLLDGALLGQALVGLLR